MSDARTELRAAYDLGLRAVRGVLPSTALATLQEEHAERQRRTLAVLPAADQIACAPRCSYCCHREVPASVPEILAIASYLRAVCSEEELGAVRARVRKAAELGEGMSREQKSDARLTCPLLTPGDPTIDPEHALTRGTCSVYAHRPIACRSHVSSSVSACAEGFGRADADIPRAREFMATYALWVGYVEGIRALGLMPPIVDLVQGLALALDHPDAETAWLTGDPLFATLAPGGGPEARARIRAEWRASIERIYPDEP